MTQALIEYRVTVFAHNSHYLIAVEASTLVCIKIFKGLKC